MKKSTLVSLLLTLFASVALAVPTAITPISPSLTPNESVFVDVDETNGNSVLNSAGDVILIFQNTSGASAAVANVVVQNSSVSVPGYGVVSQATVTCSLAASEECVVGPFNPIFYNDGNSRLQITASGAGSASLNVSAIKP